MKRSNRRSIFDERLEANQIVVVDDNPDWLSHLAKKGFKTLNWQNNSSLQLCSELGRSKNEVAAVVVNADIIKDARETRSSSLGTELVNSILSKHFPGMEFRLITFFAEGSTGSTTFDYLDFLHYLNTRYAN